MPLLSAFGKVTHKLMQKHGLRKVDLLKQAQITDKTVLTHSLKAQSERGAYAPRPTWVKVWASQFELSDQERDWYLLLAYLAKGGSEAEDIALRLAGDRLPSLFQEALRAD
jgi:hypothetical protein